MIVAATASTVALRRLPRVFVSFKKPCAVIVVPRSSEKSTGSPVFFRKLRTESARVLRAFALAAIHVARQTDNDLLGAARFGKLRYTLQKALAVVLVHDLYGTCEQLAFICIRQRRTLLCRGLHLI